MGLSVGVLWWVLEGGPKAGGGGGWEGVGGREQAYNPLESCLRIVKGYINLVVPYVCFLIYNP